MRLWLLAGILALTSCSPDIVAVGRARLASARRASEPLPRGPASAGAFTQVWDFSSSGGYFMDPARVDLAGGIARLKPMSGSGFRAEVLQTTGGRPYATLHSFEEVTGPGNRGLTKYQLSNDGAKWYFNDGTAWKPANPVSTQANTAAEINAKIDRFDVEVGPGVLYVKAFLIAPSGGEPVELKQMKVGGVSVPTDSFEH